MSQITNNPQTNENTDGISIYLASPRGFCAGVDRAISIVEKAIEKFGSPIYVKHEIVHNHHVVDRLKKKGAIFVEEIDEVPIGSKVIFSAHGVSPVVKSQSLLRDLIVFDATCPLVTKVHNEATRYYKKGFNTILIGHHEHVEVIGTLGYAPEKITVVSDIDEVEKLEIPPDEPISYITQTTLSIDDTKDIIEALKKKYPAIVGPSKDDICYATQNRQNAVKQLCEFVDMVIVVGAQNSSNTVRLVEVAERKGLPAIRVENDDEIDENWVAQFNNIGISAGASAPEDVVQKVVSKILSLKPSATVKDFVTAEEKISFSLPYVLRK